MSWAWLLRVPWWGWLLGAGAGGAIVLTATSSSAASSSAGAGGPMLTIRVGSTGAVVRVWQKVIGVGASGTFDADTERATRAWQGAHGLVADGIVGPKSWAAAGFAGTSLAPKHPSATAATAAVAPLPDVPHVDSGDSGRSWAQALPANATEAREAAVLAAIRAGFYAAPTWVPVAYVKDGRNVTIYAWADALGIGLVDPVRVDVWHSTAQRIADLLDATLPTTRMSDAAWQSAVQLAPQVLGASADMATAAKMIAHSDKVSAERTRAGLDAYGGAFARPSGKDWVNTERLLRADGSVAVPTESSIGAGGGSVPAGANFGWHSPSAPLRSPGGLAVFQSVGLAHSMAYTDYSQVLTLYRRECLIDGLERSVEEALRDPELAYLLSDEVKRGTPCRVTRHPAIPMGG